ncbi:MAG TPA: MarR family transcriptional regulator [Longimicrobiaceae bacterium]|nr:MarR family transcriptional regulator [Longimicrobiaceae bacterium]
MHQAAQNFVERMGLMMEADGLPRSAGRIFGFLLLAETPFSLDEMAEQLQVSKASVSTNARLLEQVGLLDRISAPGDRRDFYQMRPDAWERMLEVARKRWETMRSVLVEGEATLPPEMEGARARLAEAARFHAFLLEEGDTLVDRWRAGRAAEVPAPERRVS